jgi:hypothetical protein
MRSAVSNSPRVYRWAEASSPSPIGVRLDREVRFVVAFPTS